jgi:hypothetical protein
MDGSSDLLDTKVITRSDAATYLLEV